MKELLPGGNCRICTVTINDRPQAACTLPAAEGLVVLNDTDEIREWRRSIVEMLLAEGNHFCMSCEMSGGCRLQALAYRFGITAVRYPAMSPRREVDASHGEVLLDRNRCVLCGLCIRASRMLDGKAVFGAVGRGPHTQLAVEGGRLSHSGLEASDGAVEVCPVGAIVRKRVGFALPVGQRPYDEEPTGTDIEKASRTA
jgi:[NiFe] hydrogenase diaphorase moiety small subunit